MRSVQRTSQIDAFCPKTLYLICLASGLCLEAFVFRWFLIELLLALLLSCCCGCTWFLFKTISSLSLSLLQIFIYQSTKCTPRNSPSPRFVVAISKCNIVFFLLPLIILLTTLLAFRLHDYIRIIAPRSPFSMRSTHHTQQHTTYTNYGFGMPLASHSAPSVSYSSAIFNAQTIPFYSN